MAKKKENKPSALDEMLGSIYGNGAETTDTTDVTNMGRQDSVVEVDTEKETPDTEDGDSEDDENKGEFTVGNDDSDVPEHILNNSKRMMIKIILTSMIILITVMILNRLKKK